MMKPKTHKIFINLTKYITKNIYIAKKFCIAKQIQNQITGQKIKYMHNDFLKRLFP